MSLVMAYGAAMIAMQVVVPTKDIALMGFLNAVIDLLILLLPIRMVWTLQMSPKRKVAVSAIFGLGLVYVASHSPTLSV